MATITDTPGDDNSLLGGNDLIGTSEADQISCLAGRDVLDGKEGNDPLLGEEDSDRHIGPNVGSYSIKHISSSTNPASRSKFWDWLPLISFWQAISLRLVQRSQLSIQKITNAQGECWWHVTDPPTGKSLYAQTLNEVVDWIEIHRLG